MSDQGGPASAQPKTGDERMSTRRRWAYACGNAGFQIPDRMVVTIAVYFYLPPAESDLVAPIATAVWWGLLTPYGVARLVGGFVDSLADPLVGWGSDRSRSRWGRRRVFLIAGIAPMVLAPILLFWPPGAPGSLVNLVWLAGFLAVYYVFFTVYVGPYLALIPEIAPDAADRVRLSTRMAFVALPILGAYPTLWLAGMELGRSQGLGSADAIRVVVVVSALVAAVLCVLPILAVDERRFVPNRPAQLPLASALFRTLADRPFVLYLTAQIFFILGITLIQPALPYLAVVVLGRSEGFAAWLGLSYLPGVIVGFLMMGPLVERFGPKRPMIASVAALAIGLLLLAGLDPALPGEPGDRRNLVLLFGVLIAAGIPIAGFMVLPHVLISQLIDHDAARGGANRSAMYFGVQGLLTKWVYAAALALLSLLLARYGNSREQALGVVLIAPVAGLCCAVSACLYGLYPERRILAGVTARRASDPDSGALPDRHRG